jgi:hypothetical protein
MEKLGLNFGTVIAYLIPGFIGVYASARYVDTIHALLGGDKQIPEAAAIIPITLMALAIGNVINAISWALVRPLIALSGVRRPRDLDYTKLKKEDIPIYNNIVEGNFRYHQFYANTLVAILLLTPTWLMLPLKENAVRNISFFLVTGVLFFAARDSLQRAYVRMSSLLKKEVEEMTNGAPGPSEHGNVSDRGKEPKPQAKKPKDGQAPASGKTHSKTKANS